MIDVNHDVKPRIPAALLMNALHNFGPLKQICGMTLAWTFGCMYGSRKDNSLLSEEQPDTQTDKIASLASIAPFRMGPRDVGAIEPAIHGRINLDDVVPEVWELQIHAIMGIVFHEKILMHVDFVNEFRNLDFLFTDESYEEATYYGVYTCALARLAVANNLVPKAVLDRQFGFPHGSQQVLFLKHDHVTVRAEKHGYRCFKPFTRTPGYIHGMTGVIVEYLGSFSDPMLATFVSGAQQVVPLYRVRFSSETIQAHTDEATDTFEVDVFQNWLEATPGSVRTTVERPPSYGDACPVKFDGSWHRIHSSRKGFDEYSRSVPCPQSRFKPLGEALVASLVECNVFSAQKLAQATEKLAWSFSDAAAGDARKLVVRAWLDISFRQLLLSEPTRALACLGISNHTIQGPDTSLIVLENTEHVHHVVVCTLCSCYPVSIMGNPPAWYRSASFRARVMQEPRTVLSEFGMQITQPEIRVHDSTANLRYMVLPLMPVGATHLAEADLAALVTRDSLIGVGRARPTSASFLHAYDSTLGDGGRPR